MAVSLHLAGSHRLVTAVPGWAYTGTSPSSACEWICTLLVGLGLSCSSCRKRLKRTLVVFFQRVSKLYGMRFCSRKYTAGQKYIRRMIVFHAIFRTCWARCITFAFRVWEHTRSLEEMHTIFYDCFRSVYTERRRGNRNDLKSLPISRRICKNKQKSHGLSCQG